MPTQAEIQAVLNNGAGLPMDSLLRKFINCRYTLPQDSITKAINQSEWLSYFWDKEGLLNPELDFYIDWSDFCYWFERRTNNKYLEIPAGTPLLEGQEIWDVIQKAIDNSAKELGHLDIPDQTVHNFNFLDPGTIDKTPVKVEGISFACLQGDIQILVGGHVREETVFFSGCAKGEQINISKSIVNYIDSETVTNYANQIFKVAPFLLVYLQDSEVEVLKRRTKYSAVKEKLQPRKKQSRVQDRIQYRVIKRIKKVYIGSGKKIEAGNRAEPQFKVPVQGFWRKVEGVGKGPDGKPVIGKTWVRSHTRWNQKPDKKVVWVKEPLERSDNAPASTQ